MAFEIDLGKAKAIGKAVNLDAAPLTAAIAGNHPNTLKVKALAGFARIAIGIKEPLVLIGGYAMELHGMTGRETPDIDICTSQAGASAFSAKLKDLNLSGGYNHLTECTRSLAEGTGGTEAQEPNYKDGDQMISIELVANTPLSTMVAVNPYAILIPLSDNISSQLRIPLNCTQPGKKA
ncbi:hypothetical protein TWF788_008201 [Orbilia oligospora]|uniref:Uncharacterized protein n=1 Tax=Orbilia oligospora TaxID=2813651 RepID=A0A7C8Q3M0_ORBOL|nr:hypothetical protein TWF788_008201 [Orbilia oligospora]